MDKIEELEKENFFLSKRLVNNLFIIQEMSKKIEQKNTKYKSKIVDLKIEIKELEEINTK